MKNILSNNILTRALSNNKVSPNSIPSLSEDWAYDSTNGLPYSGFAVQEFIKSYCQTAADNKNLKVGAVYFDTAEMKLYTFKSSDDKENYINTGDISLILSVEDVVFSGTQKKLTIVNKMSSANLYFTTNDDTANITVSFESKEKDIMDTEWVNVLEDAYFTVSVDKGATGEYVNIIENQLVQNGQSFTFDVYDYLMSGNNRVKVSAVGTISGQTGNFGYNVTLTSMYLSPANFKWYVPFIEGSSYSLGGMNIGGSVNKTLYIKISNNDSYIRTYEKNIGSSIYVTNSYFFTELEFPTAGTGIYNIDIWVQSGELQSDHIVYNIMCIADKDKLTAKLCCISDISESVVNYTDSTLFNYATYNCGLSVSNPTITLTSIINTNPTVILNETLTDVPTGVLVPYKYYLEIETEENDVKLDALLNFGVDQRAVISIDNSTSFPSTTGYSLYINPAKRSNTQSNKESIVNEGSEDEISASWENMAWVDGTDGWTVDDEDRKCLYLPARTKVNINYQPLKTVGLNKTIEFTFKVKNASDYTEPIISIASDTSDPKFNGIIIYPNNILVHSRDLNTDDENQSYDFSEDTLINTSISIMRNYKVNYGNLCIIYVNGVKKKEFSFTNSDSWINNGNIIIGSNTSDIYLYNVRVYDLGFNSQDAIKNYLSSLSNPKDKQTESTKINSVINDSFEIDYNKTKNVANVVTIEMLNGSDLPHYGLNKSYTAQCNLEVFWNEHPEWNWGIDNIKIEGQGTSSMNYYRWNLRWRLDKSDGFTIKFPDGSTSTEDTLWFDGENNHPKVSRITAKINYASSMQSHKIGSVSMFNDVHHYLELDNEVSGRVSVYQEPFYFFEKRKLEDSDQYVYSFMGLFTFGADKGDKYTFGYKDPSVKNTLLVMEGLDHSIKSVGFDYPYNQLVYVEDEESLCVDRGNGLYDAGLEVSNAGSAETVEEIQTKLDTEFKPAYEVCYNNSTMIIGTNENINTINSDVEAWGLRKDKDGNAYQRYEFWIDGEYELYYLNQKTNQYEKNGTNLLTQLGLSSSDISGLDIDSKNELFKSKRRERFKAQAANYWNIDDTLYQYCFLLLIGATDNFKKNMYPYKLTPLSEGGRWRFRQDDMDTIFDIDNQGLAAKNYSIEAHDWTDSTKTAYVFKGEDSVLWRLFDECYVTEITTMGNKILQAMYDMSDTGTTTIERLMGFFNKYYWNKAQNYFTKSAYNVDAEFKYEEAFPKYESGDYDVDVHPLSQSLGDHLEAEMLWVRNRLIYMMSKWGFGPFGQYTDSCLGRINFRTQLAQNFTLTPAMDLYPTILTGQSSVSKSQNRVLSGEEVTLIGAGGTNTNVYIMAADELESIGDLSNLTVDASSNATISIASKRLKTIKVGDDSPELVTSNLQQLNIGQCDSLETINSKNLTSLTGTVDLSRCPRIKEAYFNGTDVRSIIISKGSKIVKLGLSDNMTTIDLQNLNKLEELVFSNLSKVEFFRVENCNSVDTFSILRTIYNLEDNKLRDIRIIGFTNENAQSKDIDMLANFAEDKDKNGNPHDYDGIDADGTPTADIYPVIEGEIKLISGVYEDSVKTVQKYFPNLKITGLGVYYFRFEDQNVSDVIADNFGDGDGTSDAEIQEVINFPAIFTNNSDIKYFRELKEFKQVSSIDNQAFKECTSLEVIEFPAILESIGNEAFDNCLKLNIELNIPTLNSLGLNAFFRSGITKITNLGSINSINNNTFSYCQNLISVDFPDTLGIIGENAFSNSGLKGFIEFPKSLNRIDSNAFENCTEITTIYIPNASLSNINNEAFSGCSKLSVFVIDSTTPPTLGTDVFNGTASDLKIYVPNESVELYKSASGWIDYKDKIYPTLEFAIAYWDPNSDKPEYKSFYGSKTFLNDWNFYLLDTTDNTDTTTKPVGKLKKNNLLRFDNGDFAPTIGITEEQRSECDVDLYLDNEGSNKYCNAGEFNATNFYNEHGMDKLYNSSGKEVRVLRPWETTETKYTIGIGREDTVYLLDNVIGISGRRWKGVFSKAMSWDGVDVTKYPLVPTAISPGPSCTVGNKTRNFLYLYTGENNCQSGKGNNNICTMFYDQEKTYPRTGDMQQINNMKYARANNNVTTASYPFAEGGYHALNTYITSMEILYGTKFLHDPELFGSGISSNDNCNSDETWMTNGGVRYKKSTDSAWSYGRWSDQGSIYYNNTGGRTHFSSFTSGERPKEACMESQMAMSFAVETNVNENEDFDFYGYTYRYVNVPGTDGTENMNVRLYKVMKQTVSAWDVNKEQTNFDIEANLRMSLIGGVNLSGDIFMYCGGGYEQVGTYLGGSTNNTIDLYLQINQLLWRYEENSSIGNLGIFDFERSYDKVATTVNLGDGYSLDRQSYTAWKTEKGGTIGTGECYYTWDNCAWSSKLNQRVRIASRFRGFAHFPASSPRTLYAILAVTATFAIIGGSAQAMLGFDDAVSLQAK